MNNGTKLTRLGLLTLGLLPSILGGCASQTADGDGDFGTAAGSAGSGTIEDAEASTAELFTDGMPESLKEYIRDNPDAAEAGEAERVDRVAFDSQEALDAALADVDADTAAGPREHKAYGYLPTFKVSTSCGKHAGTNSNVKIWMHSNRGWTGGWRLGKDNYDDFERCTLDTYVIKDPVNAPRRYDWNIDQIYVWHQGNGSGPSWELSSIDTRSQHGAAIGYERCNFHGTLNRSDAYINCASWFNGSY